MKKLLTALCVVALLGMTACQDDEPDVDNPTGDGTEHPDTNPAGEGIYNPGEKISTVVYSDDRAAEVWLWQDDKLQSVNEGESCGGYTPLMDFVYDGWRLAQTTMYGDFAATVDYRYAGDKLSEVIAFADNMEAVSIGFDHNAAGKISHLSLNVNNALLNWVLQMFGGGFMNIAPLTSQSKVVVDTTTFNVNLDWQGDNVMQACFSGVVTGSVTLGEIGQMVDLEAMLGEFASFLSMLDDTTAFPMQVAINDTIGYTYDNQHNPYCGFLGALDPANLSANNALTVNTSGMATIVITVQIPYMGNLPFTIPYPLPAESMVYTYTYDEAGYPLTVTDGEGNVTEYSYQQ